MASNKLVPYQGPSEPDSHYEPGQALTPRSRQALRPVVPGDTQPFGPNPKLVARTTAGGLTTAGVLLAVATFAGAMTVAAILVAVAAVSAIVAPFAMHASRSNRADPQIDGRAGGGVQVVVIGDHAQVNVRR